MKKSFSFVKYHFLITPRDGLACGNGGACFSTVYVDDVTCKSCLRVIAAAAKTGRMLGGTK